MYNLHIGNYTAYRLYNHPNWGVYTEPRRIKHSWAFLPKDLGMNHPAPIRINIDNQEQIASLYGVGPKLAERIVKYRKEVVFFHNPEDLANVDGISLELALALSPHIDWELPIQDTLPVGRDLFWASIFAISASSVIYIMIMKDTIPNLYYWIGEYQNNLPYAWTGILRIIANENLT